jgi:hypothetical protein
MQVNTTRGVKDIPRGEIERPGHTLNTSRLTEEDMVYIDEEGPEIVGVLPATGYYAVIRDEGTIPLVVWVAEDSGRMYGVVFDEDGRIDLVENDAEQIRGFAGYTNQANKQR